jgi:hypothetical protein
VDKNFREKRERERENGEILRDITFGGEQETVSQVLKVPRQCSLVLLLEVIRMIGINIL